MKWWILGVFCCLVIAFVPNAAAAPEGDTNDAPCWMWQPIWQWPETGCWDQFGTDVGDFQGCVQEELDIFGIPPNPSVWGTYDCTTAFIS